MENYKEELAGAIATLADARATVDEYKAIIAKLDEIIAATNFGQQLHVARVALEIAKASAESTAATLREMILAQYAIDADKHPHPAVTMKEYKTLNVWDEEVAIKWAIENMPFLVKASIEKKKLKKALALTTIPGVELQTEPRPTIARDLSAYSVLPGEEENEAL